MNEDNKMRNSSYYNIVSDILNNEEFLKMKDIVHHGYNRYGHCVRVSYYSYKISKILRLDYVSAARAGLLHDFFLEENENSKFLNKIDNLMNHPKKAVKKSIENFDITDKEENIIISHMFPVVFKSVPKYLESWVVNVVDDGVAVVERCKTTSASLKIAANFLAFIVINYFK